MSHPPPPHHPEFPPPHHPPATTKTFAVTAIFNLVYHFFILGGYFILYSFKCLCSNAVPIPLLKAGLDVLLLY